MADGNPTAIAGRAFMRLLKLRDLPGNTALPDIQALFHDVKLHDPDTSFAIARIGMHLCGTAEDGRDIASVWDEAISKTKAWLERAGQ